MRIIRVVLDTNVIVSAHLNPEGLERHVLDLGLVFKLQLFVSQPLLDEYEGVLGRAKFGINRRQLQRSLQLLRSASKVVRPTHRRTVAADAPDNRFLECAEAAKADYLVTGNKRHFPEQWRQTVVVNARD